MKVDLLDLNMQRVRVGIKGTIFFLDDYRVYHMPKETVEKNLFITIDICMIQVKVIFKKDVMRSGEVDVRSTRHSIIVRKGIKII